MRSCIFSIITPVFSVTWFRNHNNMMLKKHSDHHQCWTQLCCPIFVKTVMQNFSGFTDKVIKNSFWNSNFLQCYKCLGNHFDHSNASLLRKIINFFKKKNVKGFVHPKIKLSCFTNSKTRQINPHIFNNTCLTGLRGWIKANPCVS